MGQMGKSTFFYEKKSGNLFCYYFLMVGVGIGNLTDFIFNVISTGESQKRGLGIRNQGLKMSLG